MAFENDLQCIAMDADADLSAHRYSIMRATSERGVNVCSLNTAVEMFGVLQNKPESGERAQVAIGGVCKVRAGAAITANKMVTCNASGSAVTLPNSGVMALGRALEAAAADGDIISVLITGPVRWAGAV